MKILDQNLCYWNTIIFDCDGVILNSNEIKNDAFYEAALPWGSKNAQALLSYHKENGGISRYEKFQYFFENILGQNNINKQLLDKTIENYASIVKKQLLTCEASKALHDLKQHTPQARWLIVSGSAETELRDVFKQRGLTKLFEGGIYGSPDNKHEILKRQFKLKNIQHPALFIGDALYDFEAAIKAEINFLFISQWSDVSKNAFPTTTESIPSLEHLLPKIQ